MQFLSAILCEKSTIDSETNNISLYNCLEKLTIQTPDNILKNKVNIPINYEIVSFWMDDDKNKKWGGEILIEFYDPQLHKLKAFKMDLSQVDKPGRRLRARQRISGMTVSGTGDYIFKIKYRNKGEDAYNIVAAIPLEIVINEQKLLK